jgi:hypothetical protein
MAHTFQFLVTVELTREQGKFAARDELADALRDELEGGDPGGVYGVGADGSSDYTVDSFTVEDYTPPVVQKVAGGRTRRLDI